MKKIIDRLSEYIDIKGISLNAFDKSVGASNGYIGKQIKNKASIGGDMLEKISCIYEDLNIGWLITGKGTMLYNEAPEIASESPLDTKVNSQCEACRIRDKLIDSQQRQIDTLSKLIQHLEEKKSPEEGQKRKAAS